MHWNNFTHNTTNIVSTNVISFFFSGRIGDEPAIGLANSLESLEFRMGRLKTVIFSKHLQLYVKIQIFRGKTAINTYYCYFPGHTT